MMMHRHFAAIVLPGALCLCMSAQSLAQLVECGEAHAALLGSQSAVVAETNELGGYAMASSDTNFYSLVFAGFYKGDSEYITASILLKPPRPPAVGVYDLSDIVNQGLFVSRWYKYASRFIDILVADSGDLIIHAVAGDSVRGTVHARFMDPGKKARYRLSAEFTAVPRAAKCEHLAKAAGLMGTGTGRAPTTDSMFARFDTTRWHELYSDDSTVVTFDRTRVARPQAGVVRLWVRWDEPSARRDEGGTLYDNYLNRTDFRCTQPRASRSVIVAQYLGREVAWSNSGDTDPNAKPWREPLPDTKGEVVLEQACRQVGSQPQRRK